MSLRTLMKGRKRLLAIAVAVIAVALSGIYLWRQGSRTPPEVVEAINLYCLQEMRSWPPAGPRIVALPVSDSQWAVKVARGAPGSESVVAFAEYNDRTCALVVHGPSVPVKGPFSPTERATRYGTWSFAPLTEKEAQERATNLSALSYTPQQIQEDRRLVDDAGGGIPLTEILWHHAVRNGWVQASDSTMLILVPHNGASRLSWYFDVDLAQGAPPAGSRGGPALAGDIDIRTLRITPGQVE